MKPSVLVTGAAGYLGGRIVEHLSHRPDISMRLGSRSPLAPGEYDWTSIDLASQADLQRACAGIRCVIHLAALNEIVSAQDPVAALEVNGLGTLRLLRAAMGAGAERFIYFSTAHVYGSPLTGEINERTLPRPVHPYAITHHVAEDFVLAAHDTSGITGLVIRLSNGVGAPARPDVNRWTLLTNDLCRQAVAMRRLQLKTSGLQRRDFIALGDVAHAVEHLIGLPRERCLDGLFNLGGEQTLTVFEVTELIADRCQQVLGYRPAIDRPAPGFGEESNPMEYNIDKLKSTGFVLRGQLIREIDQTLAFCQTAFEGNR